MPVVILALTLAMQAAPAAAPMADQQNEARLRAAAQLLRDHQPAEALQVASAASDAYAGELSGEKRRIYCGMSPQETAVYLGMAAKDKVDAVAVAAGYCVALYLKGFALIDLGRPAEARPLYARLVTLAPMHAQFLTELGQLDRIDKNWGDMLATCESASAAAALAAPDAKPAQQTAALRCQGYALVEQHRLDEAEQRYRQALAIDPNDRRAQGELGYIAGLRTKR